MPRVIQSQFTTGGDNFIFLVATDGTLWRIKDAGPSSQTSEYVQFPSLPQSSFSSFQSLDGASQCIATAADGTLWRAVNLAPGTDSTQWKQLPALP